MCVGVVKVPFVRWVLLHCRVCACVAPGCCGSAGVAVAALTATRAALPAHCRPPAVAGHGTWWSNDSCSSHSLLGTAVGGPPALPGTCGRCWSVQQRWHDLTSAPTCSEPAQAPPVPPTLRRCPRPHELHRVALQCTAVGGSPPVACEGTWAGMDVRCAANARRTRAVPLLRRAALTQAAEPARAAAAAAAAATAQASRWAGR
jgi:hypothetical protein